ncbi:MAG: glycosyltransferase family 2 protein [Candidatus Eremiobacteraeota bacterium]|nr:glycosyltransferase family 2 protein [Candidatus Eremiobacteraeota bacterium]
MKIAAVTVVKNDGDVLEEFVRHTLKFVDRLVIVNNGSLDETQKILRALEAESLRLTVWDDHVVAPEPELLAILARKAFSETKADFLLLLDADEFIRTGSREVLEKALVALPENAHALIPWVTYVPSPKDDVLARGVLSRLRWRRRSEAMQFCKLVLHRSFVDRPNATLCFGNHEILDVPAPRVESLDGIELAHFPVRSLRQIQNKALLGWSMFMAMGFGEQNDIAFQWKRLYGNLLSTAEWTELDLFQYALHYLDNDGDAPELVFDPLPTVECLYPHTTPRLVETAVAYTRQLALAYAELRVENRQLRASIDAQAS